MSHNLLLQDLNAGESRPEISGSRLRAFSCSRLAWSVLPLWVVRQQVSGGYRQPVVLYSPRDREMHPARETGLPETGFSWLPQPRGCDLSEADFLEVISNAALQPLVRPAGEFQGLTRNTMASRRVVGRRRCRTLPR